MKVRLTAHARQRLSERCIDPEELIEALTMGSYVTIHTEYSKRDELETVLVFSLTEQKHFMLGVHYGRRHIDLITCIAMSLRDMHRYRLSNDVLKSARDTRVYHVLNEEVI